MLATMTQQARPAAVRAANELIQASGPQWGSTTPSTANSAPAVTLQSGVLQALLNLPALADEDDTYQVCPLCMLKGFSVGVLNER